MRERARDPDPTTTRSVCVVPGTDGRTEQLVRSRRRDQPPWEMGPPDQGQRNFDKTDRQIGVASPLPMQHPHRSSLYKESDGAAIWLHGQPPTRTSILATRFGN